MLGTRRLAASRIACLLEADAQPVVVDVDAAAEAADAHGIGSAGGSLLFDPSSSSSSDEVRWRVAEQQCAYRRAPSVDTEEAWRRFIDEIDGPGQHLFAVCITDTLHVGDDDDDEASADARTGSAADRTPRRLMPAARARLVASICRSKRIPINVADRPLLCDFSFPATHRFSATPLQPAAGAASPPSFPPQTPSSASIALPASLQIAVTTNGKGCRLAGRIRREIVASLPSNVGDAVERIGAMRDLAKRRIEPPAERNMRSSRRSRLDLSSEPGQGGASSNCTGGLGTAVGAREPSMRRQAIARKASSGVANTTSATGIDADEDDLAFDSTPLNSPVPQLSSPSEFDFRNTSTAAGQQGSESDAAGAVAKLRQQYEDHVEERRRRMRWVAQMSEYWPIDYLGSMSAEDMGRALDTYKDSGNKGSSSQQSDAQEDRGRRGGPGGEGNHASDPADDGKATRRAESQHSLSLRRPLKPDTTPGHIFLVGSGPGHPGLLTALAHKLLTSPGTDLVLSDKLVPSQILSLIPKSTPLRIARKFPGNAEGAQNELIALALEAASEGKRVIRLKQGDPFVYGRGGEEVLAFRREGIEATVVPGISSSLAAPLLLGIPVTQRGAADSMTLCTGVGRGGKSVTLPGYERGRSLVVLMGVARLHDVVGTLCHGWHTSYDSSGNGNGTAAAAAAAKPTGTRVGAPFPPYTPIAIIERASSSDQRLVASTLDGIETALARSGEQRPPGMMLIGWAALSLEGSGNVDVLDDEAQCQALDAQTDVNGTSAHSSGQELERRDRARVKRWLGDVGFTVREGLDQAYRRALGEPQAFGLGNLQTKTATAATDSDDAPPSSQLPQAPPDEADATATRGTTGWAPPRYGQSGVPRGGWGAGEVPFPESRT